jgi:hypothetical protein
MESEDKGLPISQRALNERRGQKQGRWSFRNLKELFIGAKDYFFGVNEQGLWLGNQKFEDAPFKVDMGGNVVGIGFDGQTVTGATLVGGVIEGGEIIGAEIIGGTVTGSVVRTTTGPNRVELNQENELGFPQEGLYIYNNGNISFAITQNTFFFYDNDGNLKAIIQMGSAGVLSISGDAILLDVSAGDLRFNGLPTSNPGGTGRVWNDSGTLKIT